MRRVWLRTLPGMLLLSFWYAPAGGLAEQPEEPALRCIEANDRLARAVIVGPAPLVHTAQVSAPGGDGISRQSELVLAQLDAVLKARGSSLAEAAKLNVYLTEDKARTEVLQALASAFSGEYRPAVSFVTTALPAGDALVAMDAVGVVRRPAPAESTGDWNATGPGEVSRILPPGPRVYISGQAEKGDGSLADATRQTLASLQRTLEFLGLDKQHVVEVKSFLTPMRKHAEAERVIAEFFAGIDIPPCVYVEWESSLPIEIEMIVTAAGMAHLAEGPSVEVRTPPGMSTPAVYSRLTIARHPVTIYTSGLYPEDATETPETQLRSLFTNLKQCLDATGSDWMHLVKATYYVSDAELNQQHNVVRPDYFSPRRPPAASKAAVVGTGSPGHGISMDFIVIPGEP